MPSDEDIRHQQRLLEIYRRNLATYLSQRASLGEAFAPPMVVNGILEARENIRRIKGILSRAGVRVEDHPDDEQAGTTKVPTSSDIQRAYPPTPLTPVTASAGSMDRVVLRMTIIANSQSDPLAVSVTLDSFDDSTDRIDAPSKLPFDDQTQLPALLRALDGAAAEINPQNFSSEELDWLRAEGFVEQDQGHNYVSPTMQAQIGEKLFRCLFPVETMRYLYQRARQQSADRGIQIQLAIDPNAPLIGAQPWELLFDGADFLFIGGRGALTRYIPLNNPPPIRRLVDGLRVLLISPRPSDLTPLDQNEPHAIREALSRVSSIYVENLIEATREALADYLFDNEALPHLLHFDGHGVFGRRCQQCGTIETSRLATHCTKEDCGRLLTVRRQGFLMFENNQGLAEPVSAEDFADLIGQALAGNNAPKGISLVVLSACRSAIARGEENVFNGVAQRLVAARVPAVVAMQFRPQANKAARFARSLYRSISAGQPLVIAVSRGRTELGREGDHWYRPVLYLRWRDNVGGKLFEPGEP